MQQAHFLTRIFSPGRYSPEELQRIIGCFSQRRFPRNTCLLQEGQTARQYWFLEMGLLRAYIISQEGQDCTTQFYSGREIVIDWISFMLRVPAQEHIQALTDVVCWEISYDDFQQLFHGIPAFREQGRAHLVTSYQTLKTRSLGMIATPARDRYLQLLQEQPELLRQAPLRHIASYLGITDTSLSRIRNEWSKG